MNNIDEIKTRIETEVWQQTQLRLTEVKNQIATLTAERNKCLSDHESIIKQKEALENFYDSSKNQAQTGQDIFDLTARSQELRREGDRILLEVNTLKLEETRLQITVEAIEQIRVLSQNAIGQGK